MPLIKEPVAVAFKTGVDTKSDAKQVSTNLLALENATFISPGRLRKRNGYATLNQPVPLVAGRALMTKNSGELIAWDGANLTSYGTLDARFETKGAMQSATISKRPLVLNAYSITGYDTAINNGTQVSVYEQWSGGAGATYIGAAYSIMDTVTGNQLYTASLGATATAPKVLFFGSFFSVLYIDTSTNDLKVLRVGGVPPYFTGSPVTLTSGTTTQALNGSVGRYDATAAGTIMWISFINRVGATTTGGVTTLQIASGAPTTVAANAQVSSAARVCCVFNDPSAAGQCVVGYIRNTAGNDTMSFTSYGSTLGVVLANNVTLEAPGVGNTFKQITGVSYGGVGTVAFQFFYTFTGVSFLDNDNIRAVTVTTGSYTVGTPAQYMGAVSIASKPVSILNPANAQNIVYIVLAFDTSSRIARTTLGRNVFQSTFFLADTAGNIYARFFGGTAGGAYVDSQGSGQGPRPGQLPETLTPTATSIALAATAAYRLTSSASVAYLQTALFGVTINIADAVNEAQRGELGNGLHISGGRLTLYDGQNNAELGFHCYPFALSNTITASSGSLSAGTYQYVACYEWTDAYGQVHRSAPSAPLTTVNVLNDENTIVLPSLRLSNKPGTIQITLYRTLVNGTTFYQLTNLGNGATSILNNDPTNNGPTYNDTVADSAIASNPQLYTTGNVLQNDAPPPCTALCIHRNRVFLLDATNRLSVWFSKQVVAGAPVEFSSFLTLSIDPKGGDVTALASLDDKLIVFKSDRIFAVTGQGPDSTGAQNDYSDATLVTADAGCIVPKSIVTTPQGLMFQSAKGWYLLSRSLQCSYLGAPVEAYNGETTTAAVLVGTTNQVRFTTSGGHALVYDYLMGQWSVFTNINAVDAVIYQGGMNYITGAGVVNQETVGTFVDPGSGYISIRVLTAWIQTAGLQGFQRAYEMLVLGDWITTHSLVVKVAYDFDTSFRQTDTIPVTDSVIPYQFRVFFAQQKCEAIQIQLQDVQNGSAGESLALSGLTFLIGRKRGLNKMPAFSTYG